MPLINRGFLRPTLRSECDWPHVRPHSGRSNFRNIPNNHVAGTRLQFAGNTVRRGDISRREGTVPHAGIVPLADGHQR